VIEEDGQKGKRERENERLTEKDRDIDR